MRQRDAELTLQAIGFSSDGQLPVPPALKHMSSYSAILTFPRDAKQKATCSAPASLSGLVPLYRTAKDLQGFFHFLSAFLPPSPVVSPQFPSPRSHWFTLYRTVSLFCFIFDTEWSLTTRKADAPALLDLAQELQYKESVEFTHTKKFHKNSPISIRKQVDFFCYLLYNVCVPNCAILMSSIRSTALLF